MPVLSLSIAGLGLRLDTPEPLSVQPEFEDFLGAEGTEIPVLYTAAEEIPVPEQSPLAKTLSCEIYPDGRGYLRAFRSDGVLTAVSRRRGPGAEIQYLAGDRRCCSVRSCFAMLPLEELLLDRGRMVLHAACVETPMGGILFSGPSGIGKSTQADLWNRFRNASILNGDRVILHQKGGRWMASGSPYAGSSRYYVNRSVPVAAVVMLGQGQENRPRPLSLPEAFRLIYPQILINTWNTGFVERVCNLCQELIQSVPGVFFSCTPDENAVRALDAWLKGERTCGPEYYGSGEASVPALDG